MTWKRERHESARSTEKAGEPARERPGFVSKRIVAVSLLTAEELKNVGTGLRRIYPLPTDGDFDDLLLAIDRMSRNAGPHH